MINEMFKPTSNTSDWQMPTPIRAGSAVPEWTADDVVAVGLMPEHATWDDYGRRRSDMPPVGVLPNGPYWQTDSLALDGVVTLLAPNLISIRIPASVLNRLGVGTLNVGVRHYKVISGFTETLLVGRLPVVHGIV